MSYLVELQWDEGTQQAGSNPSGQRNWLISGVSTLEDAQYALGLEADPFIWVGEISVPINGVNVTRRLSASVFEGETTYGFQQIQIEELEETVSFDTKGGRAHITQSRSTTKYPAPGREAPDFYGAIAVSSSGVEGVDIQVPALSFSKRKRFASNYVTNAWIRSVAGITGSTNNATFYGFPAGELLFEGAAGSQKHPDQPWDIEFVFSASANITGLSSGGITGIAKTGWQYIWYLYQDTDDATAKFKVRRPIGAYVETVFPSASFTILGLSGSA